MTQQEDFSNMTLQALAIRGAGFDEEDGLPFEPIAMGEYGSMTLAEFEDLIQNALQAGLLDVFIGDEQHGTVLDVFNDGGEAIQNGPCVQVCFDASSVILSESGTVITLQS